MFYKYRNINVSYVVMIFAFIILCSFSGGCSCNGEKLTDKDKAVINICKKYKDKFEHGDLFDAFFNSDKHIKLSYSTAPKLETGTLKSGDNVTYKTFATLNYNYGSSVINMDIYCRYINDDQKGVVRASYFTKNGNDGERKDIILFTENFQAGTSMNSPNAGLFRQSLSTLWTSFTEAAQETGFIFGGDAGRFVICKDGKDTHFFEINFCNECASTLVSFLNELYLVNK